MYQLRVGRLPLPKLYVAESRAEANVAKHAGIPYILKPTGMTNEDIVKYVMLNTLRKKFPEINWAKVFGSKIVNRKEIMVCVPASVNTGGGSNGDDNIDWDIYTDVAEDYREFVGGDDGCDVGYRPLDSYIGSDMAAQVTIEELQALHLLPTFLDDIAEAIKRNLYGLGWTEGYNKKHGVPIGNFNASVDKPNLMILDVSGSIPKGVSTTMLTLIDTLRTQCNADLIITGSRSMYWENGEPLPDPQWIRNNIGYNNEAKQFYDILRKHVLGRKWGNVIVFGDSDCPSWYETYDKEAVAIKETEFEGTEVDKLWSYHTCRECRPGYALWCDSVPVGEEEFNNKWVEWMTRTW